MSKKLSKKVSPHVRDNHLKIVYRQTIPEKPASGKVKASRKWIQISKRTDGNMSLFKDQALSAYICRILQKSENPCNRITLEVRIQNSTLRVIVYDNYLIICIREGEISSRSEKTTIFQFFQNFIIFFEKCQFFCQKKVSPLVRDSTPKIVYRQTIP